MTTGNYVVLLGTKGGPAIRPGSSMPAANLIVLNGQKTVVDCGLGVTKALVDQGMPLNDLSLVFITHLHSDHYIELGALLHTAWTAGLKTPVSIFGPVGLAVYWDGFLTSMRADIDLRIEDEGRPDLRSLVAIHEINEGQVYERDGLCVSAIRTRHPPLVDCFALKLTSRDATVVFSGDTAPTDALTEFTQGADLLIHEAMLEEALPALVARVGNAGEKLMSHLLRSHTFAQDAARTAADAGVKALALSHLIPADDSAYTEMHWREAIGGIWDGPLFVGSDGLKIDLPVLTLANGLHGHGPVGHED